MAMVYRTANRVAAHEVGVHVAVIAERDRIASVARARFASHDNPGGHEITTGDGEVDALVSLEGPAPFAVEFGHVAYRGKDQIGPLEFVRGLHILTGAIGAG